MNPRHRRLVIPLALVGLLLIVVIAAVQVVMAENLLRALAQVRGRLLDPETLVRAVASGRQKAGAAEVAPGRAAVRRPQGRPPPPAHGVRRDAGAHVEPPRGPRERQSGARDAVDDLLDEPFGNWHLETTVETVQLRVTRKGEALVHTSPRTTPAEVDRGHDRDKERLLPEDDPLFRALGLADADGRLKPSRRDKYRQVEEFLRLLDTAVTEAIDKGQLRRPTAEAPLRVVDLGCGNAYLTFAAERFLVGVRGLPVHLVGVDVKEQSREHNEKVAGELGLDATFVVGSIGGVDARPGARGGARPARVRHRDRRGAGPRGRVAGRAGAGRARAATTTWPRSSARRRPPRRTPCSPGTASSASGWPTP